VTAVDGVPVDVAAPTRTGLSGMLAGASATPLLVLFGLNLVDELDRIAFAALTPEIRDAFDLGDGAIVAIGAISAVFILFGALPLGYLGDRMPRTRIATTAALIWGSMAVLTGVAWVVPMLFAARLFSGVARTSNEVVHPSLLADYYSPAAQPRVFQIHRLASPLSAIFGIVAGGLGATVGWRATFILAAVPTFVLLVMLARLEEPRRGASVDPKLAEREDVAPLSFREARASLFGVRTLRRCWLGGFLLGIALIAVGQLLSLFFEDVYGFGPFGRGVVQFSYGSGIVAGIFIGARAAGRAASSGRFERLPVVVGASFVTGAVALGGIAAAPWSVAAVLLVFVFGIGLGVYQPAYYPLVARIVQPLVRTQAYGWTLLFVGCGALFAIPLARFGENVSYRAAFGILAVVVGVGAAILASASSRVRDDVARADAAAAAAVQ
jgi:branched-chain amino acid transport system ATP-binding protein